MVQDIANTKISLWKVVVLYVFISGAVVSYFLTANAGQDKKIDSKVDKKTFIELKKEIREDMKEIKKDNKDTRRLIFEKMDDLKTLIITGKVS